MPGNLLKTNILKRFLKILRYFFISLISLVVLLVILVNLTPVQNFLARKAAEILAKKLHTKVSVGHVRIDFLNHVLIQGLYIEDRQKDTLLYAGEARVRITDWFFLKNETPVLRYLGVKDAYAHLYRTPKSAEWNYQFVVDAFDSGAAPDTTIKKRNDFELDLEHIEVQNLRFHMDDAWAGSDMDFDIGNLQLDADELALKKKMIDIRSLALEKVVISMHDYEGGRPRDTARRKKETVIDTTAFNPDRWYVTVDELGLKDCRFVMNASMAAPLKGEFDPDHMDVQNIQLMARNLSVIGDTMKANLEHLAADERCGLQVKEFSADVSVSPKASICKNLLLETNRSRLQHYYAMRYERFPDFTDYITKVYMEADLKESYVDLRDVAFFAPVLNEYPYRLELAGKVRGTVDSIAGRDLVFSDGQTRLKGNAAMVGLPDIDKTFIRFEDGEIFTTGPAIMKYAPDLKNNPNIAVEHISYAYFKGSFAGYIDNFAANGTLNTNLGNITSDVKMVLPPQSAQNATYAGTISTQNFQLGTLLREPILGSVTMKAKVDGKGFDPENGSMNIDAEISQLGLYGYNYRNISAQGKLAQRTFEGEAIVDDPNLALSFDGKLDFSQEQPVINAKAYLLKSDFRALGLTDDSLQATADFDFNTTGSNIDNFTGTAKLYNINLLRYGNRLALDSIQLVSSQYAGGRRLSIESNDITATIDGSYSLSQLAPSFQYFLGRYLPNYVKSPSRYAPDQNLSFNITTRNVDGLLAVLLPDVRGFNNSTIVGSLNTPQRQLALEANIPAGTIGNMKLENLVLKGDGNFDRLAVDANAARFVIGNDMLDLALRLNSTIGNDSLRFSLATTSPDVYGTASINGQAYARGDSLHFSFNPSEVMLGQSRWEIPAGAHGVFASNYLHLEDFVLRSGLQQISLGSDDRGGKQALLLEVQNLDISQMGSLAGLSSYQPDGRVNGSVRVEDMFRNMIVESDLRATGVKMGADTIGDIILQGRYDAARELVVLQNTSGIFRGNSSLAIEGTLSLDTASRQKLNGHIRLNQAPLTWLDPILAGYASKLKGTANGEIDVSGTAANPDVSGAVTLNDAGVRVDMIGVEYRIPFAKITLDNRKIDLGNIKIYDRFGNEGIVSGTITHQQFQNMRLSLALNTRKLEAVNLRDYESEAFYGNLIAEASLSIRGPLEDLTMSIRAIPVQDSRISMPIGSSTTMGAYSYVSFRTLGTEQQQVQRKSKSKLNITIDIAANPLAEISLILDPASGDAINARGTGSIKIEMPSSNDIRMYGTYVIDQGDYTFTLKQVFFQRKFLINSGSTISFSGPIEQTKLNVTAILPTNARLYDLLSDREKEGLKFVPKSEEVETKQQQRVNLVLFMTGALDNPELKFKIDLPEKRAVGTMAYAKLERLNNTERELFDQVASLLLGGSFFPPEGNLGTTAAVGAINNIGEIISSAASGQITNLVNKILGDDKLAIDLKYKSYSLSDGGSDINNRNEIRFGVRRNFFKDKLIVELGSAYDWGRVTGGNSSNFNPVGDFRAQYLITDRLRLNLFNTSNYDILVNDNITRRGVGVSYRKTFDSFEEFFRGRNYMRRLEEKRAEKGNLQADSTIRQEAPKGTGPMP